MKDLIETYLKHTEHYLAGAEIDSIYNSLCQYTNEPCYDVTIKNETMYNGKEVIRVGVTELLEFMWSKIKCL